MNLEFVFSFQNVASFLTKDLQLDWRLGAEWFESQLVCMMCVTNSCLPLFESNSRFSLFSIYPFSVA